VSSSEEEEEVVDEESELETGTLELVMEVLRGCG
jgi:hypothetical protein